MRDAQNVGRLSLRGQLNVLVDGSWGAPHTLSVTSFTLHNASVPGPGDSTIMIRSITMHQKWMRYMAHLGIGKMNLRYMIFLVAIATITFAVYTPDNSYNVVTGAERCSDDVSCRHEQAHRLDQEKKWISGTRAYQDVVQRYRDRLWLDVDARDTNSIIIYQFPGIGSPLVAYSNPLSLSFWRGGWGGYRELYASMGSWYSCRTMPTEFKRFYNCRGGGR